MGNALRFCNPLGRVAMSPTPLNSLYSGGPLPDDQASARPPRPLQQAGLRVQRVGLGGCALFGGGVPGSWGARPDSQASSNGSLRRNGQAKVVDTIRRFSRRITAV